MAELLKEDDEVKAGKPATEELIITEEDPSKKPDVKDAKLKEEDDDDERDINPDNPDETDDEREAIRERRRLEKLERKERRDKAIARDKIEMEFLRKRNDDLEKRFTQLEQRQHNSDLTQVEQQINKAMSEVDMAEKIIAKAIESGNGADVTKAMRYRDQALQKAQQLSQFKEANTTPPQRQSEGMDDRVMRHAKEFLGENKWYDPQGRDEDSAIVLAIDQTLVRDGYDPKTEEYWDELRTRASRRLPDRFGKKEVIEEKRESRGGPALGSGREHAPSSTRREVYISPERKQALVDAGVWDDPVLRQKYVKRYAEYDRTNRA